MNLYLHTKNQAISSNCSRDIVDLKILQPDWPRAFWPVSQETNFFKIWALCSNKANKISLQTKFRKKLMNKFFNNSKKPTYGPFLGAFFPFSVHNILLKKSSSIMLNLK